MISAILPIYCANVKEMQTPVLTTVHRQSLWTVTQAHLSIAILLLIDHTASKVAGYS
jgi:hypothetical protein